MSTISDFITLLSTFEVNSENTENLYCGNSPESNIRRHNLKTYLEKMKALNPDVLLVGEAPGYKGCALTGIPFTSEFVLSENPFFDGEEYRFINKLGQYEKEQSATIVWEQLSKSEYKRKPLIWNIFPFHPHEKDKTTSNREPNVAELRQGLEILEKLLKLFDIKKIVAVGRKSESQLKALNIDHHHIRHPANGGKEDFAEGLRKVLSGI